MTDFQTSSVEREGCALDGGSVGVGEGEAPAPTVPAGLSYEAFLESKTQLDGMHGFEPTVLPESMFDFQRALVDWALKPAYYRQALKNLAAVDETRDDEAASLFDEETA